MWPDLDGLVQRVRQVAREEVMPRFRNTRRRYKPDGSVVTEADLAVQDRLGRELGKCYPGIELLGEEMEEARQRELVTGEDHFLWCLDPVDGTSNFASGLPFFSISLALMRGHEPVLGIVHDPILDESFTAIQGQGARLNGERLVCPGTDLPLGRCLAMVDFKRLDTRLVTALANQPPYSSLRYTGSGALEWCWLAAGRFQLYLHGRQKLWDFAAGALILAEAGGMASTLDGEPIYAPGVLSRSVVAAPNARLFSAWRQAIALRQAT